MPTVRLHRKVWVAWGRAWAVQYQGLFDEVALGVRLNWRRPLLDLYLGPVTLALGRRPQLTDGRAAQAESCRGFLIADRPVL